MLLYCHSIKTFKTQRANMFVRIKFTMTDTDPLYIYTQVKEDYKNDPPIELLVDEIKAVEDACRDIKSNLNGIDPFIVLPIVCMDGYDVWANQETDHQTIKKVITINTKYISSITFGIHK